MKSLDKGKGIKPLYSCSHCGLSVHNRGDWCDLGCGDDYNQMTEIKIPINNPFEKKEDLIKGLVNYLQSL